MFLHSLGVSAVYVNKLGYTEKTSAVLGGVEYFDTYTHDYVGNVTQALTALDASKGLTYTSKCEYDWAGRAVKTTNALGQYSQRSYNALGQNVSATDYSGSVSTFTYDALGRLVKHETPFEVGSKSARKVYYDQAGNVTREQVQTNAAGASASWSKTEYAYNNRGHLTSVTAYDGVTPALTTSYTYDAVSNLLTQSTNGATNTYTYDRFGNVLTVKDPLNQVESYVYDLGGRLTSRTDRNGWVTSYTYDGLGRALTQVVTTGNAGKNVTQSWTYTLTGALKSESNGIHTVSYTYDELGRLTQTSESGSVLKNYTYNLGGARTGFVTSVGGVSMFNTTYEYDTLGRLQHVKEGGVTQASYTYDTNGNRSSLTYANGSVTTYTYNQGNMITSLQNKVGSTVQSSYSYVYNLDGSQKSKTDNAGRVTQYTYDGLGRLTVEAESGFVGAKTYGYTYDARSNRATMNVNGGETYAVSYTYDANNRLLKTTKAQSVNVTVTAYGYDGNGNTISVAEETYGPSTGLAMTVEIAGDGWEVYEYNGLNQQVGVTKDGVETTYAYKANGLRLSKTTNGVVTKHIWDGGNIVLDVVGVAVVKYLRGVNLISSDGQYYGYNAHGDVVQLTNSSGAVTKTYRYDAFGVEQDIDTSDTNVWRYCGEYWDVETETIYLRARYYNPRIGRFTQSDPAMDGLNWYTYCVNNPIRYWDPSGRVVTDWDLKHCTPEEIRLLEEYTNRWVLAEAAGNKLGMAMAHNAATAIRNKYLQGPQVVRSDGQIGVGEQIVSGNIAYGIDQSTQFLQSSYIPATPTNQSPEEVKNETAAQIITTVDPNLSYSTADRFDTAANAALAFGATYYEEANSEKGINYDRGEGFFTLAVGREHSANIYSITDSNGNTSYFFGNVQEGNHAFIGAGTLFSLAYEASAYVDMNSMGFGHTYNHVAMVHIHPTSCSCCPSPQSISDGDELFANFFQVDVYAYYYKNGQPGLKKFP